MEKIKLQIDILKIKLAFFTGLAGGVSYLFLHIDKLKILKKGCQALKVNFSYLFLNFFSSTEFNTMLTNCYFYFFIV